MKPSPSAAVLAGAVLGLAAVTGCSAGTHAEHPGATPYAAERATAPPAGRAAGPAPGGCPTAASPPLPLPKEFPADLPVPHGAIVTSVEHRTGGRLVVATVVRDGFDTTLAFLHKRLPEAGYTPEEGEVEEDDAESDFSSATVRGRWTLRKASDCGRGVYLTYLTSGRGKSDEPSHRSP
ncbi:hypothetical protein [Streptomyces griseoluteus]|uniref:hypothetical protein n=1 Tax=Streptomyces griseoluteus TaxID=29306 RepID=UPI00142F2084|nr:hypothetical protein [Streptomyces griseoluteus]GHF18371.1 hypothetical protein GCM10017776_40300 [Streptomyces griseoluteus]